MNNTCLPNCPVAKARRDFLHVVSHELMTPLSLIKGYGAMLQDKTFLQDKTLRMETDIPFIAQGIMKGVSRLEILTQDLIQARPPILVTKSWILPYNRAWCEIY